MWLCSRVCLPLGKSRRWTFKRVFQALSCCCGMMGIQHSCFLKPVLLFILFYFLIKAVSTERSRKEGDGNFFSHQKFIEVVNICCKVMEADSSMTTSKAHSPPVHLSGDLPSPFSETKQCFRLEIQSWLQHKFCVYLTAWQIYPQNTDCRIAVFE